ncbi:MAG: Ig-like domain-containing protein, partial [Fimbriimonadaceae bacterium]
MKRRQFHQVALLLGAPWMLHTVLAVGLALALTISPDTILAQSMTDRLQDREKRALPAPKATQSSVERAPITVQPNVGRVGSSDAWFLGPPQALFSSNGQILAVNNHSRITLWDIATGRPLRILQHFAYFRSFVFTADGSRILSLHQDGHLRTWDPLSGRLIGAQQILNVINDYPVGFWHDPSKQLIAATANTGKVVLWDYNRNSRVFEAVLASGRKELEAHDARLSKDGKQLIVVGSSIIQIIDLQTRHTRTIEFGVHGKSPINQLMTDTIILVKTNRFDDCEADLYLVNIAAIYPSQRLIERAVGCKKTSGSSSREPYGRIAVYHAESESRLYLARGGVPGIKIIDLTTDQLNGVAPRLPRGDGDIIGLDNRFGYVEVIDESRLRISNLADASPVAEFKSQGLAGWRPFVSTDGKQFLLYADRQGNHTFVTLALDRITPIFQDVSAVDGELFDVSVGAKLALFGDKNGQFSVLSLQTGLAIRFYVSDVAEVLRARLSPDGGMVLLIYKVAEWEYKAKLVATRSGEIIAEFNTSHASFAGFSADGRLLAIDRAEFIDRGEVEVWSLASLRMIRKLDLLEDQLTSLAFSQDGRFIIGGGRDSGIRLWNAETGKLIRTLDRNRLAGHVSSGGIAISRDGKVVAGGPMQRNTSTGDIGRERRVAVWDVPTGKLLFQLDGHEAGVGAIAISDDDRWIVSASFDGTIRYWHRRTGQLGATFAAAQVARWVIVTDKGFFAASAESGDLLSVVRRFEATSIEQIRQSLYAPDLVREYLAGDPNGEVKAAETRASLQTILDSGPAPAVAITSPTPGGQSAADLVSVSARLTDRGKGIGRVEWRVNGITAAVTSKPTGAGPDYTITQQLALDPGDNVIEVVAYNGSNLLASVPARTTIKLDAAASAVKPKLHILAIGI